MAFCLALLAGRGPSAEPPAPSTPLPRKGFTLARWAREPMLKNPVALSFDDHGRLYVVETARRSTVDIDIRAHPSWILDDLSNQSIEDLRRFFRARMAPEFSAQNARWLRDYNGDGSHDWRDLMAVKERVHVLEDTRGLGKADRALVFAEGFNEEISGVIAGVMPWQREVFVTVYPDLWRLRDTDGDGIADQKESLFRGFGVHAAFDGHDLHGLTVGPEGKIYFSIGDNGFSVTNREGRRLHHPNTGGVLRMNPDGSDLEVFAIGLRNPQEIAFDEFGNLFSVDNDGDLEDERERFVYITEGSDSGWRLHWQFRDAGWSKFTGQPNYNPWIAERMWVPYFPGQPAHLTPPLANYSVGPAGFKYNPGTALNEEYRRCFFLVQFPVQKITAFQTKPKGASFEMVNEHLFVSGMMASAVNFSPDGALFIADWDGMWEPNEKGAIWTLDDPKSAGSPLRREVKRLLAEGMTTRPSGELANLLGHADMRIRQRAQFELAKRNERSRFLKIARAANAPQLARIHALWGLGQLRRPLPPDQLPFADVDPEIRAQSAKIAGDLRLRPAGPELIRLLGDPSPRVRFQAGLALGKVGDTNAVPALITLLAKNEDRDPFLRQSAVMGLAGCARPETLARLHQHDSAAARLGAVVALRRLRSPLILTFLQDPDIKVRRETARAIHDDDSIPDALPALASLLDLPDPPTDEAIVRRALNANLRLGTEAAPDRLLRFATNALRPEPWRVEALDCLGAWSARPYLDRVEGLVRRLPDREARLGDQLLRDHLGELLSDSHSAIPRAVTRLLLKNRIEVDPGMFADWVLSSNQSPTLRVQSLELLAQRKFERLPQILRSALEANVAPLRAAAMRVLATNDPAAFLRFLDSPGRSLNLSEHQLALRLVGPMPGNQAAAYLARDLEALLSGRLPPDLTLDVLQGCRERPEAELRAKLASYEAGLTRDDPLAKFRPALAGGDAAAGRELFRSQTKSQCVRCHEAGGEGFQAGPVLAGIASRVTPDYLLESLIEPSRRIADGFANLLLELQDGEEIDGIKLRESPDALTLRASSGEILNIPRVRIKKQSFSQVSAMPPMGDVLSLDEIRDLMAYLATLK